MGVEEHGKVDPLVLFAADVEVERVPVDELVPDLLLERPFDGRLPRRFSPKDEVEERVGQLFGPKASVDDEPSDDEVGHVEGGIRDRFDHPTGLGTGRESRAIGPGACTGGRRTSPE